MVSTITRYLVKEGPKVVRVAKRVVTSKAFVTTAKHVGKVTAKAVGEIVVIDVAFNHLEKKTTELREKLKKQGYKESLVDKVTAPLVGL